MKAIQAIDDDQELDQIGIKIKRHRDLMMREIRILRQTSNGNQMKYEEIVSDYPYEDDVDADGVHVFVEFEEDEYDGVDGVYVEVELPAEVEEDDDDDVVIDEGKRGSFITA